MSDLFDFEPKINHYAVFGNPVKHSRSPQIHRAFAKQTQQNIDYSAIQVDPGGFAQAAGNFAANGGKGFNVTVPFKQDAWSWVNSRSAAADIAGAVNTVSLRSDGSSHGDNTDGIGLVRDLTQNLGIDLHGKRLLVLGAGGAVRGVLTPLLEQQPAQLVIANRSMDKAHELASVFQAHGPVTARAFTALNGFYFDLIVNGTSASLHGDLPPLPDSICGVDTLGYDMMYGAQPTVFMHWCATHGARTADGLGMLVEQAAESFFIWRGIRPATKIILGELRQSLK
jgi:shikimate dehydrogenase